MQHTLFIGLGNPGEEYERTYHNAGWEALRFFGRKLQERYGPATMERGSQFHFETYGPYAFVYPDTFMNRSGMAVERALAWFKKTPADIVVLHDDSDLAVGEYRIAADSGAAGHHGAESIAAAPSLRGVPITRVRIGIRDPREKSGERPRRKAGEFVLKRISATDHATLEAAFADLASRLFEEG